MTAHHTFSSGNSVEISYDGDGFHVSWDIFPPRPTDIVEWQWIRHELMQQVLPPGTRFAIIGEAPLMPGCPTCED